MGEVELCNQTFLKVEGVKRKDDSDDDGKKPGSMIHRFTPHAKSRLSRAASLGAPCGHWRSTEILAIRYPAGREHSPAPLSLKLKHVVTEKRTCQVQCSIYVYMDIYIGSYNQRKWALHPEAPLYVMRRL